MWKKSIIPSPVRSACIALETARKNRILIRILFPFLFYIPYTVMGHIGVNMNSPEVQKQLLSWLSPSTVNLLSKHSILIFVGFLIFYFFLIFFGELVRYAASVKKHFSKKDLISIIECLDSLTEAKNERFEHCLKNCEGKDALALFNSFTTPHQNKLFVVKSIKNLFDLLTNSNIMVGLLEVVDNKPIKWLRYLPSSSTPTVDVEKYLNPNCSICHAITGGAIIIIDNLKRFFKKNNASQQAIQSVLRGDKNGSTITYPIIHSDSQDVIYIISLKSNKLIFNNEDKKAYELILGKFADHIVLEHNLQKLKRMTLEKL